MTPAATETSDQGLDQKAEQDSRTGADAQQLAEHQGVAALVDPEWLESNASSVRIIGLGQTLEQYNAAHVPGEQFVDWKTEIAELENPDQFNLPSQEQFEALLSRLGVTADTTIVLSDNMSSRLSVRMFWTLRYFGHGNVKVLDGGRRAWIQSGRDFTHEVSEFEPTEYRVASTNPGLRAELEQVRAQLDDESQLLIDSRVASQYSGEEPGMTFQTGTVLDARGHIPGAINVAWPDNFTDGGKFKTTDELRELYSNAGADGAEPVITYCNEGIHATAPWFVMTEILGHDNVRVYDASMAEWAEMESSQLERSDDKQSESDK